MTESNPEKILENFLKSNKEYMDLLPIGVRL